MKLLNRIIGLAFLSFFLVIVFSNCLGQNIRARENLAKCEYKIERFDLKKILFSDNIIIQGKDIVNLSSRTTANTIIKYASKIRRKDFKIKINHVLFDLYLKIKNTTDHEVVLDHLEADIYIDKTKVSKVNHKKFTRINPGKESVEKINVKVPFDEMKGFYLKKPKTITFDAKVYVNILIGDYTLETPWVISIKKTILIPYNKIQKIIDKKKNEIVNKYIKKRKIRLKINIKKKLRKLF